MKRIFIILLGIALTCSVLLNIYLLTPTKTDNQNTPLPIQVEQQPSAPSRYDHLANTKQLFAAQRYEEALQHYSLLVKQASDQADDIKLYWFEQIRAHIVQQQFSSAKQLLQLFLQQFPYDTAMLQLEAQWDIATANTAQGITKFVNLYLQNPQETIALEEIQALIKKQIDTLLTQQAWQEIIEQSAVWLELSPLNPDYIYAQAFAYFQLGDIISSQTSLEQLSPSQNKTKDIAALEENIRQYLAGTDIIPLEVYGSHFLLTARINDSLTSQLMIDTGASFTVLNQATINNLSQPAQFIDTVQVNTANGAATAERYRLSSIQIGQQRLENFEILVIQNHTGYGLLGMNFLKHYQFNINQQQAQLELQQ